GHIATPQAHHGPPPRLGRPPEGPPAFRQVLGPIRPAAPRPPPGDHITSVGVVFWVRWPAPPPVQVRYDGNLTFTADRRSLGQREGICYAKNIVGLGFGDDAWLEWLRLVSGTCRASRASRSRGSKRR